MKIVTTLVVASAALTSVAGAVSHNHRHAQYHKKRDVASVTVDGPVEVAYVFEGRVIPESQVCQGLQNGTFEWAQGTQSMPNCNTGSSSGAPPASPAAPAPSSSSAAPAPASSPTGNENVQQPSSPAAQPSSQPSSSSSSSGGPNTNSNVGGIYELIATNSNVDVNFPDGEVDCSTFPSAYGAVPVSYLNLNGFTGVQETTVNNGQVGNINTATSGGCSEGAYCSYACPAGYMKTQFPEQNSGTSVGGLQCSGGKLHRSNTGFNTLCTKGAGSADVQNNLDGLVCICGTDYPGTEAETVPICVQPSGSSSLAITDGSTYYKHGGSSTSAQYYVNQKGTSVQDACQWGTDQTSQGIAAGNWASVVIGLGQNDDGQTFVSLLSTEQNYPEKVVSLGYSIALSGDFGGSSCSYNMSNGVGQFCSESGCQEQGQFVAGKGPVPGCTVQLMSGQVSYTLSE